MVADFYLSRLNRDDPTGLFYALEQLYADGAFVCPGRWGEKRRMTFSGETDASRLFLKLETF